MFHGKSAEWKTLLGNEDEEKLNDLLKSVSKHREIFKG